MEFLEDFVGETGADVADCFVRVAVGVVARQQKGAEDGGTLAFAVVSTENDKVERVAYAGEVVFLDLFLCKPSVTIHVGNIQG